MEDILTHLPAQIEAITTAVVGLAMALTLFSKRVRGVIGALSTSIATAVRKIKDALKNGPGGPGGPAAAVIALFVLSGCAAVDGGLGYAEGKVEQGIVQAQRAADIKSRAVVRIPCTIEVGSYHRELSEREKAAVDELCGGGRPTAILRPETE